MVLPLYLLKPTNRLIFASFDNQLPEEVFRAKGILWLEGSTARHIFHLSGKRFGIEDDRWKGTPKNKLVFIGQNLETGRLRKLLEACVC